MPFLHRQFTAEAKDKDGNVRKMSPAMAMGFVGPRLQVAIGLPPPIVEALLKRGEVLPPPVLGEALLDTGASMTCIDQDVVTSLRLPEVGKAKMHSASHANHETTLHPIRIAFQGVPIEVSVDRAMAASLKSQGIVALIGRDVLAHGVLVYNGFAGEVTFGI